MTISYQMFSLGKKYLTKEFLAFGVMSFFMLSSAFMIISSTCIPSASAFMNQNLLGLYSPTNPVPIVPTNPSMNSFYGGGIGPSFGTGLVGLLPQVLGGIGSLFGQDSGSSYSMGGGYGGGYDSGYQSHDDQGFSDFQSSNDPFASGSDSRTADQTNYLDDYNSDSSSSSPFDDLRSTDSSSSSPFDDLRSTDSSSSSPFDDLRSTDSSSSSPFDDLRSTDSSSGDPFSSNQDSGSSDSISGGLFD
jgi:hypothetical protein